MTVSDLTRTVPVRPGLNSVFLHVTAEFSSVALSRSSGDSDLCVDTVEVGQAEPGFAQ